MASLRVPLGKLVFRLAVQHFGNVFRILRRIWLEVTGAIFLALAAFGVPGAIREWRLLEEGGSVLRLVTTILFIVMMAGFGIYSFWKSYRLR